MKKCSKLLEVILVICLLAMPVSAVSGTNQATLTYRGISISSAGSAGAEAVSHTLKAGAGVGEIKFPESVITGSGEGFKRTPTALPAPSIPPRT